MTAVGDTAPEFTLKDQNGNDVTLSSFRFNRSSSSSSRFRSLACVRASSARSATHPVLVRAHRRAGPDHHVLTPATPTAWEQQGARYEQMVRTYRKFADHPAVQGAAGVVRAKIGEKIGERLPAGSRRSGSAHSPDGQVSSASRRSGLS